MKIKDVENLIDKKYTNQSSDNHSEIDGSVAVCMFSWTSMLVVLVIGRKLNIEKCNRSIHFLSLLSSLSILSHLSYLL